MNHSYSTSTKLSALLVAIFMLTPNGHSQGQESAQATEVDISLYMPLENDNYWSYMGDLDSDDISTRVNIRNETDSTVFVDENRSFRTTQEVVFSRENASSDDIQKINRRTYQTSAKGWNLFREESDSGIYVYKRPIKALPMHAEIQKSYKYKTTLDPDFGLYGVVSFHTVLEGFENIEIANGSFQSLKINQEIRRKIAKDEKLKEILSNSTEYHSYWLVEGVGVIKEETNTTIVDESGSSHFQYDVDLVATDYLDNYLWPDAESTDNGWKYVEWFGYLTDDYFPWVYHHDHGWLWIEADDASDIKIWSESLGWWITSKELYPTFFSLDLNEWLTYNVDSTVERKFIRSDGTIITASSEGFRFRPDNSKPPSSETESPFAIEGDQEFYDSRGNRYIDSASGIVSDQGELPEVKLISPFVGTLVNENEPFLILADAFDKDGEITQVKILVNGQLIALLEKPPYQIIYKATDDETYNVVAIAIDNDGNTTQSETVTVEVDLAEQKSPEIRVHSPLNRSVFKSGTWVSVELKATDADGFVESVALLVDGIQVGDALHASPYYFKFQPPVDGTYKIGGKAVDDDENLSETTGISITVNETGRIESDKYPPEVRITSPLNESVFALGTQIEIEAYATDENGSIDRVQILVDGIQVGNDLHSFPYRVHYTPPQTGTYAIKAVAKDNDRNETTSTSIDIIVE